MFVSVFLAIPAWSDAIDDVTDDPTTEPAHADDWACVTHSTYPRNFVWEFSEEVLEGRPFTEAEIQMSIDGLPRNDLHRLLLRPDFSDRWQQWLNQRGLPSDWKCKDTEGLDPPQNPLQQGSNDNPESLSALTIGGIQSTPQHSVTELISLKKNIVLRLYDAAARDGDKVLLRWNGLPVPGFLGPIKLGAKPGIAIKLTLSPSDTLSNKTNRLTLLWFSGGQKPLRTVTAGISVVNPNRFYNNPNNPSLLSSLKDPNNFVFVTPLASRNFDIALGLACVDREAYPESAAHILAAQAQGYARIVMPDRGAAADKRRKQNVEPYKKLNKTAIDACVKRVASNPKLIKKGCDVDEYPQALFKENQAKGTPGFGKPSMLPIHGSDNKGSGSKIGSYATLYNKTNVNNPTMNDQLEVIVPEAGGKLYCPQS